MEDLVSSASYETVDAKEHYIHQEGQTVFKFAVKGMADVSAEIMERNNLKGEDVAWLFHIKQISVLLTLLLIEWG